MESRNGSCLFSQCLSVLSAFLMFTIFVPGARGGEKRASDPLKLDLQKVAGFHANAEIQTWVLCKDDKCS